MYRDYAINRELVHWESQSFITDRSATAQRYFNHRERGTSVLLFARETKDQRAFMCLGLGQHVEHRGERPVAVVWRLDTPLTEAFFLEARAGAA